MAHPRQQTPPQAPARAHGHEDHACRVRRLGDRRSGLGRRLGRPGRQEVHRRDPPCGRARRQLDRYGGDLRARPFRGGGARGPEGDPRRTTGPSSSPSAVCSGTRTTAPPSPGRWARPTASAARSRSSLRRLGRRADRPLPDALAGEGRHAPSRTTGARCST